MNQTDKLLGVVLCGGKSQRMGTDKANLQTADGTRFVEHAAARLAAICDSVVLSANQAYQTPWPVLMDPVAYQGPIGGIVGALRYAREQQFRACFVTAVDMPDLSVDDLHEVTAIWRSDPSQPVCGIGAVSQVLQPLVAIYPAECFESIATCFASQERSLKRWFARVSHRTVALSEIACRNVNAPDDWNPLQ